MLKALNIDLLHRTFYDRTVYPEVVLKKRGVMALYVLLLIFIYGLCFSIQLKPSKMFPDAARLVGAFKQFPEIKVRGSEISYSGPEKQVINYKYKDKSLAVFYSGNDQLNFAEENTHMLFLKNKIIVNEGKEIKTYDFSDNKEEYTMPKGAVYKIVSIGAICLLLFMIPFFFLGLAFLQIIRFFVFALFAYMILRAKNIKDIDFKSSFRLSVAALTPDNLFASFCILFFPAGLFTFVFYNIMGIIYLGFGVRSVVDFQKAKEKENPVAKQADTAIQTDGDKNSDTDSQQ